MALLLLVALPAFLAALPGAAGQEGTVAGTLTVDGVSVAITHVYATAAPGFFDKDAEDVHVLLSSAPLTDEQRSDVFAIMALAREDKVRAVEVVIDAEGSPIGGSLFAKAFEGMVSAAGMHRFERERQERSMIAGRLSVDEPHTFMGVTWSYDARFTAPIPRDPTPEEREAALASPPALAAAAYVEAVLAGNLPAFLATLSRVAAGDYSGPAGAGKLALLAADMPDDSRVVGITPQTDGTVVASVEGHRAEDGVVIGYTLRMVREGAAWKVGK